MGKFTGRTKANTETTENTEVTNETQAAVATSDGADKAPAKSIVPNKYAGKYKKGGEGPLQDFLKSQVYTDGALEIGAFFTLCEANGLGDHVAPFRAAVAAKAHGAEGRARMTLGNRLANIARKNQKLVGLNGSEYEVAVPPLPKREKATQEAA